MSRTQNPASLAREAIAAALRGEPPEAVPLEGAEGGVVVVLRGSDGRIRGSLGSTEPSDLGAIAVEAASQDPRFVPVAEDELDSLQVVVWLLAAPRTVARQDEIREDDALEVRQGLFSGLLLPDLHVGPWDPDSYLRQACRRAGLDAYAHRAPSTTVRAFRASRFEG